MDSQILTYWDIGIISFFGGYSSWHFLLSEIHFFDGSPFSKEINTQEALENVVQEEALKLGINSNIVQVEFDHEGQLENYETSGAAFKNGDHYKILLEPRRTTTRKMIRHELYHIAKGHCDHHFKNPVFDHLDYLFRKEVQATLYGSFGIKI